MGFATRTIFSGSHRFSDLWGETDARSTKPKERVSPSPPAKAPADKLIQMIIQKGVRSEEEGPALYQQGFLLPAFPARQ
jgi:hypothetical protein